MKAVASRQTLHHEAERRDAGIFGQRIAAVKVNKADTVKQRGEASECFSVSCSSGERVAASPTVEATRRADRLEGVEPRHLLTSAMGPSALPLEPASVLHHSAGVQMARGLFLSRRKTQAVRRSQRKRKNRRRKAGSSHRVRREPVSSHRVTGHSLQGQRGALKSARAVPISNPMKKIEQFWSGCRDFGHQGAGVAVYTGMETKMALNYKSKSQKRSAVEKSMNTFLMIYLVILLFEAVLSTILKYAWQAEEKWDEPWYNQKTEQERNSSKILKFISDFLAFLVLYNFIIPISLYVTVEMQKFLGSFFIGWDLDLYHEESDEKAQVNTSDLNEELGQVEYVFTDKTGTLTENEMQFRECSINGVKYQEINGKLVPEGMAEDLPDGVDSNLSEEDILFLKAASLCHTVQISYDQADDLGDRQANGILRQMEYYASSPDEKALVEATKRYKLLHILEFDANRRRMSVILQTPSGEKILFTKGAESSILPYTKTGEIDKTRMHVDELALKGLRTLVIACRHFTPEEYIEIDRRLHEARTALQQREERLADVFSYIEKDFELLGAVGVEDKLQEKVQETIEALRMAGIKVWVLTGDKHETAVSVSLSCGHFHRTMNILELVQQKSDSECAVQLRRLDKRIKEDHVIQHGLVVDGASLSLALRQHEKLFMDVCRNCTAVLCCRMAPLQKAKVVRLLKTSPEKPITLAIGDGANDVSMIQEAHVGIGIMGKEGRQAVRNSDYAIARPFLHTQDMYFVFVQLLSSGSAWFAIILIVITCLFPDVIKNVFYRHLQPTNTQKTQLNGNGIGISCLDSMCCFSDGEKACAPVGRMLDRMIGRSWSTSDPYYSNDRSILTLSQVEATPC
ncbi:AT11B ATPase, partial [Polypterus senegalus]